MATFLIILLSLIVLIVLIHYIIIANDDCKAQGILALIITFFITILSIIEINTHTKPLELKQPIQDSLKVENTIVNDSIIKSDTTYIYTYIK